MALRANENGTLPPYCFPLLVVSICLGMGYLMIGYDRKGYILGALLLMAVVGLLASLVLLLTKGPGKSKP